MVICVAVRQDPSSEWSSDTNLQQDAAGGKVRTLTVKEIRKLAKEFPFLGEIVDLKLAINNPRQLVLKGKISVADRESLYVMPRFSLPPHYQVSPDSIYVGHKYPSVYAVSLAKGTVYSKMFWNYDNKDFYAWEVLEGGLFAGFMVLVIKYKWWNYIEDYFELGLETFTGSYSHDEYQITIFKRPKFGFAHLIETSDLSHNVKINDLLMLAMSGRNNEEASEAYGLLEDLVTKFEVAIGRSLRKTVKCCKTAGMSGMFGRTELWTFVTGGSLMLSFWSGPDNITFVGDESNFTRTGLQSMNCTVDTARRMVEEVVANWAEKKLLADEKVSIF